MRADRHYVDLIASRAAAGRERGIAVTAFDPPAVADVPALVPLIDSVKQHGILQPLIVTERGGLRVIAGQRRLAAAIAAGLREVPCLVHDVDDEVAEQMRAASNGWSSMDVPAVVTGMPGPAALAGEDLARSLATASSLADLLTGSISDLSRGIVGTLLRAELWRSSALLEASRAVRGELAVMRGAVPVAPLVERVIHGFAAERRVRHVEFVPHIDLPAGHLVMADERLLASALGGAVLATLALVDALTVSRVTVVAGLTATKQLTLVASQDHVQPAATWAERAFDAEWRDRPGGTAVSLGMAALQHAARVHGGDSLATLTPRGSRVGLTIPAGA
jgi:hypothetical protein